MKTLRATLITLLVTAASLVALYIPLNVSEPATQPKAATGATISLVDSLPSQYAKTPSVPEKPKTTRVQTQVVEPILPPDNGIISMKAEVAQEIENLSDPIAEPILDPDTYPLATETQEKPIPDSEAKQTSSPLEEPAAADIASLASVAASLVSPEPLPSLVEGYYEATSTDQGPSFNRTALASRVKYPSLAKRQGMEGLVILRLYISSTGKVERIEVEEDPGYGLAEAAIRAFTDLQGEPAILGGKAVPVTLRYPVRFTLQ